MIGTFGGALEARQIDASHGKLTAEVTGEVEKEGALPCQFSAFYLHFCRDYVLILLCFLYTELGG